MSFNCQRCRQPLRIDESLADINRSAYDMMSSALAERAKAARRPQYDVDRIARLPPAPRQAFVHATSMNRHPHPMSAQRLPRGAQRGGPPFGRGLGPAESFVVLSESTIVKSQPPTAQPDGKPSGSEPDSGPQTQPIAKLTRLYNLLSTVSEIDHPLCIECGDFLMERMGKQLENAKLDRQRYKHFESEVAQERITEAETVKALQAEVSKVKETRRAATDELRSVESEREALERELEELTAQESELADEEEEFWREFNQYQTEADELKARSASIATRFHHDFRELERLNKANVYNDAFCIGLERGMATINGLRLGRLPDVPVEWAEIDAGLGDTALLLQNLASRFAYTFEGYRLIPMGSFSKIERTHGDKAVNELYGSDAYGARRLSLFPSNRFNNGMVDFLECLRQLGEVAMKRDPSVKMPYRINKDKIHDDSIKYSSSSEEQWTRALKHVLATLKLLNQTAAQ